MRNTTLGIIIYVEGVLIITSPDNNGHVTIWTYVFIATLRKVIEPCFEQLAFFESNHVPNMSKGIH